MHHGELVTVTTTFHVPTGYIIWPDGLASSVMSRQSASDRITVTLSSRVFLALRDRADREGRSSSNLAAFLLESALVIPKEEPADPRLRVEYLLCD